MPYGLCPKLTFHSLSRRRINKYIHEQDKLEYTKYFKKEKKNPEIVIGGPGTNLECHVDDLFE